MTRFAMRLASIVALLPAAGCGLLPDAYSGCNDPKPYDSARQAEPLRVPAGADLPDTHNALKIPDLTTPELPPDPGTCLDHPPPFGKERPQPKHDS
jgi:uncharacterized lipoprotein